jgi:subtilisin family serine protease
MLVLALSTLPLCAQTIGINVVLNTAISQLILADLGTHGRVRDVVPEINAVTLQAPAGELPAIQALPYVLAANPDQPRNTGPVQTAAVTDYDSGLSTWDLDAINVTDLGAGRTVAFNGDGVYVAVLDTGLVNNWPYYFPASRIAVQYAKSFGGGGGDMGFVSSQPNKWGQDQNSHGTHVTSTVLVFNMYGAFFNGVAPSATVIPVKVLNQNGSGWSSVIARGIAYVTELKKSGALGSGSVVINMSLGGSRLDIMEQAAIDDAVSHGVIIVASAGNNGSRGMGYPGAYAPVISVAAAGWYGTGATPFSWFSDDVPESNGNAFYVPSWSSRARTGQSLDVTAPGDNVVGPYQVNGQISYYYLSGTSMASPHVTGVVALMVQKNPALTADQAHSILKSSTLPLPYAGSVVGSGLVQADLALANTPTP